MKLKYEHYLCSLQVKQQNMEDHIEIEARHEASDSTINLPGHESDKSPQPLISKLELAELDSKAKCEGVGNLASSSSASSSPVQPSRARTAVWRQKVHSGVGAPVLAGQKILEFPSTPLPTQIATAVVPGQRVIVPNESSRPEIKPPLPVTLPVAYRSLPPPSSNLMTLSSTLLAPATGIRIPAPGLSPLTTNLSLYSPGLPLTAAGQRRISAAPSNLTPGVGGGLVPLPPPTNVPRHLSRPPPVNNGHTAKVRSGHICHSSRQSCSQYCLQDSGHMYKFCLWHILEDPSAPYKQCDFVEFPTRDRCRFPVFLKSENTKYVF